MASIDQNLMHPELADRGAAPAAESGGYMGLVVAALAAYIGLAELCEITYQRPVLPLFPLAKR